MSSASGVNRTNISSLKVGMTDQLIVGVIIANQSPRKINKEGIGGQRGVWDITLRDSPDDDINVSFWGSLPHLNGLSEEFHIGDVVDIINAKISVRSNSDHFRPHVSSHYSGPGSPLKFKENFLNPFQLTMSDNSNIVHHEGDDNTYYKQLLRIITKPTTDIFTIADVRNRDTTTENEAVDLLAAVRHVEPLRNITTKDGRSLICRTVIVMDYTSNELPFQIWNKDLVNSAQNWQPRETVLFIADVRVEWNAFKNSMVAVDRSTTVVIENPDIPEADSLRHYVRDIPLKPSAILENIARSIPDPTSIREVMSVRQVLDRAKSASPNKQNSSGASQFCALLFCLVTRLDLDGYTRVTATKCAQCKALLSGDVCENAECPAAANWGRGATETSFDIRVDLSDHTGTLEGCQLTGEAAEKVLNCTAEDFLSMTEEHKTELKWTLLLERCAVRIVVLRPSACQPFPCISILACSLADPAEVAALLPLN